VRYKSFANAEEMKKDVVAHNPTRFEIGPVYTGRVSLSFRVCEDETDEVGIAEGQEGAVEDCVQTRFARVGIRYRHDGL
jgi:hypothetical protein